MRLNMEGKYWLLILLGIGMLVGATQIGINTGFNYGLDNYSYFRGEPNSAASNVREVLEPVHFMEMRLTYQQVMDWLRKDKTDAVPYGDNNFTCVDYSAQVKSNAELDNIRCGFMYIWNLDGTAHAIVVFDTTDRGFVYVEPQFDWVIPEPKAGLCYDKLVSSVSDSYDYTYTPSNLSIIKRVRIIW